MDLKARIAVLFCRLLRTDLAVRRQDRDFGILHPTETVFCTADTGGHVVRIEENELCKHAVKRDRVRRQQQDFHGLWGARCGTVAFHGDDAVHQVKPRSNAAVEVAEHVGKGAAVRIHRVPGSLVGAVDAAILILDGAGNVFKSMRLHLAKADHGIRLFHFAAEHKFFADPAVRELDGLCAGKVAEYRAVFLRLRAQPGFLDGVFKACGRTGAVPVGKLVETVLAQAAKHCAEDGGVGGDCLIGRGVFQKIRLNENVLLRRNEPLKSAEHRQPPANCRIHGFFIIIAARQQNDLGFFHSCLRKVS